MELGITRQQEFPPRLEKNMMSNENYGEFAEFVYNSNNDMNNIVADIPIPKPELTVSKLNPGMFNATVNRQFSADTRINLKKISPQTTPPKITYW